MDRSRPMAAALAFGLLASACATPIPPAPSASGPPAARPDHLVGEVFYDPGWPSAHNEGCLTIMDPGHVELIMPGEWFLERDRDTGWFLIRDGAGEVLMREHTLARVTGRFLDDPGCREGRLFEVAGVEPAAAAAATLYVEVVFDPRAAVFAEGSVNVVRASGPDGEPLLQQPVPHGGSVRVPSGPLTIVDFQKPCTANCSMAHGHEVPCQGEMDLAPGEERTITVLLHAEPAGCELLQRPGPAADLVGLLDVSPHDSANLPHPRLGRCVTVAGAAVPVLPDGWQLELTGSRRADLGIALIDPAGEVVARDGDLLWLDGRLTSEERPFGCDVGHRFDVSEVVATRPL